MYKKTETSLLTIQCSQSYGFLVVMHGCESWTIKNTECRRIDVFKLWCWRRLLRVIGKTDAEAEAPILWLPDAELTHWKRPQCWEILKAAGEGGDRG